MEQLSLSDRAFYDHILKVARTIADLAASERIEAPHLPKPSDTAVSAGIFFTKSRA